MSFLKSLSLIKAGAIIILFSSCQATKNFTALDLDQRTINSIDSICLLQLNNEHYPGLAIAVAEKGNRVWSKGYGFSDLENKRPIDAKDDLFRIGSISKTVTACALARLKERKIVSLDVPISNYYHECPSDKDSITLRQLGGHLAGIRHYNGLEFLSNIHYTTIKDAMEVFIHDSLLFEPGTKYSYSTYGWTLISEVMQDASGTPFTEIIRDEVSRPLKLADLKPDFSDSIHFQRVQFYEFQNDHHSISPQVDLSNKWAGGGYLCSAEDLVKFGYAVSDPGYLKASTLEEFTTPQALSDGKLTDYGIGFRVNKVENEPLWYGHSGGSVGGTSMLLIYPVEDIIIVTLVNLSGAKMDDLAMKIADIVRASNGKQKR